MSKILVTGGAGFIGSHLTDRLVKNGHRVVIIDNLSTGKKKFINPRSKFYKISIIGSQINKIFLTERPEVVFHLAAQKSVNLSLREPLPDAQTNIIGSLNIIENSLAVKVKKLIFISTGGAIYGQTKVLPSPENTLEIPSSPYGLAKLTVDNYLKNFYAKVKKLPYVSLRLSNVYGPRQDPLGEAGVIAIFINRLLKNQLCHINGSGKQTRDFIYVDDVVSACLKSIDKGEGIYNIGTGKETSINELYQLIADLLKVKWSAKHQPEMTGEVVRSVLDNRKAMRKLLWRQEINLKEGINKTVDYFLSLL